MMLCVGVGVGVGVGVVVVVVVVDRAILALGHVRFACSEAELKVLQ